MNASNMVKKQLENFDYPFCHDCFTKYEKITKIGQGTFGEVFKARNRETKQLVALKKILMDNEKEGFPITALREIKILQLLRQENIVHLLEICLTKNQQNRSKPTFYLVFEFCEHDLAGLLSNLNVKFSLGEIKKIMQQLLNGLYFIHNNKILHRDMKAANILITKNGVLKLADFGLARAYSLANPTANPINANRYTNRVVTLWYRPPELLLGERNYGPPIDMWGAGCIMAELWTRSPIMQGQSEQHQLNLISQLCGSITTEVWPECDKLELYNSLNLIKDQKRKVKERLKPYVRDNLALDLLDKLLWLDPSKRIDSDESLNHDFFWTDPMPADLAKTLSNHTISMFEFFAQPPGMAAARGLVKPGGHHGIAPHNLPHFPAGMPAGKGLISGSNRPHHYGLGPPPQQQTNTVNNQNINNYSKNFPHGSHGPPRRDYNKGGGAQHHQYHHQRYHPYGNNKGDASSLNNAASGSNAAQNSTQSTNLPQNQNNNSNHANN